MLKRYRNTF